MSKVELIHGDCMEAIAKMKDNFIDAIVTDPPYGLSFMGKKWDYDVPSVEIWKECLRILKPGGHLLSFGGSRTYHRMAVNIEDAGFEIRDQIMWVYGSGFPKSLNIGKAVDKLPKARVTEFSKILRLKREELKLTISEADELITSGSTMYSFFEGRKVNGDFVIYPPNKKYYEKIVSYFGITGWDDIVENNLQTIGEEDGSFGYQRDGERWEQSRIIKVSTTKEAKEFEGWGTALKPAHEPIVLARKPISEKSIAENCLKWGVGGINIDGCRVSTNDIYHYNRKGGNPIHQGGENINVSADSHSLGRFPANLIHDGSQEVLDLFPNTKSVQSNRGKVEIFKKENSWIGESTVRGHNDSGSAARFFYCAKASKAERNRGCGGLEERFFNGLDKMGGEKCGMKTGSGNPREGKNQNNHPTVKPIALMEYLVKLVTREGQTVLDPFAGSGTTGIACKNLNREAILIEREAEYVEIAERRNS